MGDMGWTAEEKAAIKARKAARFQKNNAFLDKVTGFVRTELTPYQIRISHPDVGDFVDLYPTNQRYHILKTGKRGRYKTAQGFLDLTLLKIKEIKDE